MSDIIRMEEQCAIYASAIMDQDNRLHKAADRIVVLEGALGHAEREVERLRAELAAAVKAHMATIDERNALRVVLDRAIDMACGAEGTSHLGGWMRAQLRTLDAARKGER
jgi:hypothetical protein